MPTPVGESDPEDMTPEVELELAPLPPALALALGSVPNPDGLAAPFSASKVSLAVFYGCGGHSSCPQAAVS